MFQLKSLKRTKRFLVAIDTDGCVADNMNGKQMFIFHSEKNYAGDNESKMIGEFKDNLPELPPWKLPDYDHLASYRKRQELRKKLYKQFNPEGRLTIL
ncbi:hypothetical protein [Kosmotoga pacifica]|uniref:Uncharacterized protein n=1 Tax=Kosmotoga pacifica TaxID=1330330 RepID=A0A0G2ZCY1_9BACT|nr:hypothetical protein [Kosmotoga pacifica]AKI97429.1 hypothetical protein IX53_05920 [Kosmotoga pacifica]